MKVGLLITSIGNFGQKGFYNAQEIGLAKELDKLFDHVVVYKAVQFAEQESKSRIEGCSNSTLYQVPVKNIGINGIWDCSVMDPTLDALIFFSDTQIAVPNVYKWCCKNNVQMFPYIGVIESHSTSAVKKRIINLMFRRNISVYKKCICFVKTPIVAEKLSDLGIQNTVLTPVGLDLSLLNIDYENTSVQELKHKYGYQADDKVLLFIGRLIDEKQPLRMIDILSDIKKIDPSYKLLMVGSGELRKTITDKIKEYDLDKCVQMIDRIPNKEIWELYRMADSFINLNQQEIFGMAILESMYYGCKVVAWNAPGPSLIIESNISGYLVGSNEEAIEAIENQTDISDAAHNRIVDVFTWKCVSHQMLDIINGECRTWLNI